MTKKANAVVYIFLAFIFIAVFSAPIYANSAAPPSLTLVVLNAPDDINIYLDNGSEKVYREFSLSDPLFRFRGDQAYSYIIVEAENRTTTLQMPDELISGYDNYAVLDCKTMKITVGQPFWRAPLLIFFRVSFTLIIEGIIFLLFKFRAKRDIAVFILVNIITQTALNIIVLTETNYAFLMVELIFLEILIFIIEAIAYSLLFTEYSKAVRVSYSFFANLASLFVGGAAIYLLPF